MISKIIKKAIKRIMWIFPSIKVFMFHHVTDMPTNKKSDCILSTEKFYSILHETDEFISCEDIVRSNVKKIKNKVAVTFDDGLSDLYTIAYPYIQKRKIPITIFIILDFLDMEGYITVNQLEEMSKNPLVTIGAHGVTHQVLPGLPSEQKWHEIYESKIYLEKIINKEINLFAFSHGQYDKESLKMVKKAGYKAAFSVEELPINLFTKKLICHLPRFNVINEQFNRIYELK